MGWKPEVLVGGKWGRNALVFASKEEAEANAFNLMMRWTLVEDSRAVEVEEAATHTFGLTGLGYVTKEEAQ
jgi:hypothetical protein